MLSQGLLVREIGGHLINVKRLTSSAQSLGSRIKQGLVAWPEFCWLIR